MNPASVVEIDVLVGNNTLIDPDVFQLWLEGYSAQDAAAAIHRNQGMKESEIPLELLKSDVIDHYRTLQMLERLLHSPVHLAEQWTFQLMPETQEMLIEKYYDFNNSVVREFLGKKLSSRNRKDLDEVSERTGVDIKSCRRQFDNIKTVYKAVEELQGPLLKNIRTHFLLPEDLAKKYAAVVYITHNRFETGKKKLHYLSLDDFIFCANDMINAWSCKSQGGKDDESELEIDKDFLHNLREVKTLLDKDHLDKLREDIAFALWNRVSKHTMQNIDSSFKSFTRMLVNIANGLSHSKELRDFFVDLVEKIIEPCRSARWTLEELQAFMDAFTKCPQSVAFAQEPLLNEAWVRYISTLSRCACRLYAH
ncbi:acidic fibroblast growth factor intracellular-binding protein-like [Ornithodoros turicata]|uniref:acidic fibroblast growth factor intracellular-binding protein-like n=1 Tax=Ornithodoros turicata TaxID=34597 RepID=UPI003138D390